MHRHVHASYQCVVPETGEMHIVEKLQPAETAVSPASGESNTVFTGPSYYACPGFNIVSHLKDAHGRIIGFRMYRSRDPIEDPVEVTVASSAVYTYSKEDHRWEGPAPSSVTIDHSGKHVPRKESS